MLLLVGLLNLVVGTLTGIAGIAGFLLPIFFVGYFGIDLTTALALSFTSFLVSGLIGSYRYQIGGNMDFRFGLIISIGSFLGAMIGVYLNTSIDGSTAKIFLYMVVLLSGISILIRKDKERLSGKSSLLSNKAFVIFLGVVTGCICSLSGAGGPVLVMPILVSWCKFI
ncbi:MAG: sulfite exporter TauE/SafE family protein [Clostridium sp.]